MGDKLGSGPANAILEGITTPCTCCSYSLFRTSIAVVYPSAWVLPVDQLAVLIQHAIPPPGGPDTGDLCVNSSFHMSKTATCIETAPSLLLYHTVI